MPLKTIRLPVTIGVRDPAQSRDAIKDKDGRTLEPATSELKMIQPGQPVELEAEEADRLLAKFGPYTETVVVTDQQPITGVQPAQQAAQMGARRA